MYNKHEIMYVICPNKNCIFYILQQCTRMKIKNNVLLIKLTCENLGYFLITSRFEPGFEHGTVGILPNIGQHLKWPQINKIK